MLTLFEVNWLAILVSTLVAYAIGGVWYSPKVFGSIWMDEQGHTEESLGSPMKAMGLTFFTSLLSAWVLAVLVSNLKLTQLQEGIQLGLLLGGGLMLATRYSDGLYNNHTLRLSLIEGGYRGIYVLIVCVILTIWH